jgi:type II secretory pathway pseudopilin PulG
MSLKNILGVTLIEAVMTVGIFAAGLVGVMYIFFGSTTSSLIADQTVVAGNLAREKMEQIIADRANKGYAATIATNYSDGLLSGNYNIYTRNAVIQEVDPDDDGGTDDFLDASPGSGYARVTVTLTWGGNTVKEETLLANYVMP